MLPRCTRTLQDSLTALPMLLTKAREQPLHAHPAASPQLGLPVQKRDAKKRYRYVLHPHRISGTHSALPVFAGKHHPGPFPHPMPCYTAQLCSGPASQAQQRLRKVGKSRHTAAKRQKVRSTRLGWGRISPSRLPPLRKQTRQLTALSSLLHSPLSKALARHPPVPPLLCRAHAASAGPSCPLSRRSLTSSALSLFIFFFFPFEHISLMESKRHFSDSGVSHCPIPASSTLNAESFSRPIWN